MRIALICLQPQPERGNDENAGKCLDIAASRENLNISQTVALAMRMRDGGTFAPVIICGKNSPLEAQAAKTGLPQISIGNSLWDMFSLWRWQRTCGDLNILSIGPEGLALARRLARMRGKRKTLYDAAFFISPPRLEGGARKSFLMASHCICGSSYVAGHIAARLKELPAGLKAPAPEIVISPPGIELENYNFPPPAYTPEDHSEGRHFVFGMAGALQPSSGALLVVRAMSALWQKADLPPWEVRMFGSGPRFQEILDEAESLGVASRLSILSCQPLGEVSRYCHAWLAPGRSPEEMPEILWAGFAARLPVICAQDGLHKERLDMADPNAAITVTGNNPQEMASAMIEVMSDGRLREALAAKGDKIRILGGVDAMADRVCALMESWLPADAPPG